MKFTYAELLEEFRVSPLITDKKELEIAESFYVRVMECARLTSILSMESVLILNSIISVLTENNDNLDNLSPDVYFQTAANVRTAERMNLIKIGDGK